MSKYKLCIWDWNGTISNDFEHIYECGPQRIFKHFHLPCPSREQYRNEVTADFMIFYHAHRIPPHITREDLDAIMAEGFKKKGPAEIFPDALEAVSAALAAGCVNVLVSAYDKTKIGEAVNRCGLAPHFSYIVGGVKHKTDEFACLMDERAARGAETAIVGDTVEDALAATAVDATPFICPRGFHTRKRIEEVKSRASRLVIIDTLKDLLPHLR